MSVERLSLRVDKELGRALSHFSKRNKLTQSQATRELLRRVLTDADDVTRGWREGFAEGYAEAQKRVNGAMAKAVGR